MNDIAGDLAANNKMIRMLFDERKEMIDELMAMVKEMHKIVANLRQRNLQLEKEIQTLKAKKKQRTRRYSRIVTSSD